MKVDSSIGKFDRIAYLAGGVGMPIYAFTGGIDSLWLQGGMVVMGLLFFICGIRGI